MKKQQSRKKEAVVQAKDLAWVKGASGYSVVTGNEGDPTDPPPGDGGS